MLHAFTRNHSDHSTEAGFQFEFFCDCCGNGFKSTFVASSTYGQRQKSERFGYRIRKAFAADPADGAVVITYTIVNESGETRQVAPWEISRVPNGGVLFFDATSVEPANNMAGLPFEYKFGAAWYVMDEARENRKVNADGKGWLAFSANGILFVKKFQDLKPEEPAPAEAEIQVRTFCHPVGQR